MIPYATLEAALVAWLALGTGLTRIIFTHQQTPPLPYLTLSLGPVRSVTPIDEVVSTTDLTQPAGQEVQQSVYGQRTFTVSVQAFTIQETGAGTAKELLASALLRAATPTQRALFNVAGIAFLYAEPLNALPRLGPVGQGRAAVNLHFAVVDSIVNPTGYIASCTPAGTLSP